MEERELFILVQGDVLLIRWFGGLMIDRAPAFQYDCHTNYWYYMHVGRLVQQKGFRDTGKMPPRLLFPEEVNAHYTSVRIGVDDTLRDFPATGSGNLTCGQFSMSFCSKRRR